MIADASGSIGTTTYQRTRAGLIIRARVTPANPATARQVTARNALSTLTTAWGTDLTEEQRTAWSNLAAQAVHHTRPSVAFVPDGKALYIRNNMDSAIRGVTRYDTPPPTLEVPVLTSLTASGSVSGTSFGATLAASSYPTGLLYIILTSGNLSPGRSAPNNTWKYLTTGDLTGPGTAGLWSLHTTAWGTPTAGQKTWVIAYARQTPGGNVSPRLRVGFRWT